MAGSRTPRGSRAYRPVSVDGTDQHAESLAVDWLLWLQDVRHRSGNTLKAYNIVLRNYLQWCAKVNVEPLHPGLADVESFMTRVHSSNGRKGSASTQNTDAAALRGWFSWMHERGMVTENPTKDLMAPAPKKRMGRPIEDEHWQALWGDDLPPRMRLILGLGFYAGLRTDEIGSLTVSQVTPSRIRNFIRKGGGEDTTPYMDMAEVHHRKLPHLLPDLEVFRLASGNVRHTLDGKLIPWQHPKELYRWLGKQCKKLDIPQYTPHQMRHSCATNLLRAGISPHIVMRLMNHTSMDTTMSYVRAGASDLRQFLDDT